MVSLRKEITEMHQEMERHLSIAERPPPPHLQPSHKPTVEWSTSSFEVSHKGQASPTEFVLDHFTHVCDAF